MRSADRASSGRAKESTKTAASCIRSWAAMSARVRASAVAVTASRGTCGNTSANRPRLRYSGRKSWPHWLTQCASSTATTASLAWDSRSSIQGCISPSGET